MSVTRLMLHLDIITEKLSWSWGGNTGPRKTKIVEQLNQLLQSFFSLNEINENMLLCGETTLHSSYHNRL